MKRCLATLWAALTGLTLGAQSYYQDCNNPEILHLFERNEPFRREIILPTVNGYTVYKADLHTHTAFSDGSVLPSMRVEEAWQDGLDMIAVTEHIEYRPNDRVFLEYLEKCGKKAGKEVVVDLNFSVREARKAAEQFGLLIIPGTEITRHGAEVGHFNALFTTDNNLIYHPDALQSIRNAKAQNAIVMHNHPGWIKTSLAYTDVERAAYDEGLIDGVEVMNDVEFYPGIVDRVQERGLFISGNSDIHGTTANSFRMTGIDRPMTFILAEDRSLESIREALESRRTLAYGLGAVCGEEQLLKDFFAAGVEVKVVRETQDRVELSLTNRTSIPYTIRQESCNQVKLNPFTTILMSVPKGGRVLKFTVLNMFCGADRHPEMELGF